MNWTLKPTEVPEQVKIAHAMGRGMLIPAQVEELVKAINPSYVETKQRLTYLAQHQARAEMNRIFGYGNWDIIADDPILMYEEAMTENTHPRWPKDRSGKPKVSSTGAYWFVAYRIRVTVDIRDLWGMPVATYTGVHAEENAAQPNRGEAHALALTSVDSYALRRALINLGDRFGLGLYHEGSTKPHGQYTIQQPGNPNVGPGALYTWVASGPQAAAPQVEQAPAPQGQAPTQSPRMQKFNQAQQQVQAAREQARQEPMSDEMRARLQGGLKQADADEPEAFVGTAEAGEANG